MIIISNNLIGKMPIPDDAVIRLNLAWVKSYEEAKKIIDECNHDIYLDFPSGRTKPPKPTITIDEAIELSDNEKVKFFAVSNAESPGQFIYLRNRTKAEIVPKIETRDGVGYIPEMIECGLKTISLDKEDLYTNVGCDGLIYELLVERVRSYKDKIKVLELVGVCFQ